MRDERDPFSTAPRPAPARNVLRDFDPGVWFVATVSGSAHILDLDRRQVMRQPTGPDLEARVLRRDGDLIRLVALVRCQVGDRMKLTLDLGLPGLVFTERESTTVIAIQRIKP